MVFPIYIHLGPVVIHPHLLFEGVAYVISFLLLRGRLRSDSLRGSQRSSVMVGGMIGALIGAKVLVLLQHLDLFSVNRQQWLLLVAQGKTVVGALLGGVIGVEWTKSRLRISQSTGDVFVFPLIAGTAIGRVGCFMTGLSDRTYGTATLLPWGIDFGDGILRHPTQIYEILFLICLAAVLTYCQKRSLRSGILFQLYLSSYLGFRPLNDFLKPDFHLILGMSAIQIACGLGLVYCGRQLVRLQSISSA